MTKMQKLHFTRISLSIIVLTVGFFIYLHAKDFFLELIVLSATAGAMSGIIQNWFTTHKKVKWLRGDYD